MEFKNKNLEDFNEFLKNKNIAIIGLGVSNLPLVDYLEKLNAKITVFENKELDKIDTNILDIINKKQLNLYSGKNYLSNLKGFDVIFRSPSCMPTLPEIQEEIKRGALVITEIELVLRLAPCKTIGVTGSDGKTTTTTLIYEILKKGGHNCHLGGNIGIPLFTKLDKIAPEDIIILELSSFQLMDMEVSPNIAVITNITPNHLDIHSSYEEYIEAKKNIFKFQNEEDLVVLNYDNELARKCATETKGKVAYFSKETKLPNGIILDEGIIKEANDDIRRHLINTKDVFLRGTHNYENICTAIAATSGLVKIEDAITATRNFKGVEHRIEFVGEINGAKWYNDSIGSSPTRTIAGINSFDEEIILIAGGYDKNLDYTPIAEPIVKKVKTLILLGPTADKIYNAVNNYEANIKPEIIRCTNLEEAVKQAKKVSKKGQVILFSPASASFDSFKNFMERGEKFKELVKKL